MGYYYGELNITINVEESTKESHIRRATRSHDIAHALKIFKFCYVFCYIRLT